MESVIKFHRNWRHLRAPLLALLILLLPSICFSQSIRGAEKPGMAAIRADMDAQRKIGGNHVNYFDQSPQSELSEAECDSFFDIGYHPQPKADSAEPKLGQKVFGWHPWYMGSAYYSYDFSALSTISYYGYEVNPANGNPISVHNWKTTDLVTLAHAAGCKVELTVTNTTETPSRQLFSSPSAVENLIDNLIEMLFIQDADGITLDFEDLGADDRFYFINFLWELRTRLSFEYPRGKITVAVPPFDWDNVYDLEVLDSLADQVVIMGYNFYGPGSLHAGPSSVEQTGAGAMPLDLNAAVDYYRRTIDSSHLILALPWYGFEWKICDTTDASFVRSVPFRDASQLLRNGYELFIDTLTGCRVYQKASDNCMLQVWMDTPYSYGKKLDLIAAKKIGGAGIWGLGYDNGMDEYWDVTKGKSAAQDSVKTPEKTTEETGIIAWLKSLTVEEVIQYLSVIFLVVFGVCFVGITYLVVKDCRTKEAVLSKTNLLLLFSFGIALVALIGYNLLPGTREMLKNWFPIALFIFLLVTLIIFLLGRVSKSDVNKNLP
jgi:spore germination protein YaaH/cbb3-type cytochrome oxidase subunit 3